MSFWSGRTKGTSSLPDHSRGQLRLVPCLLLIVPFTEFKPLRQKTVPLDLSTNRSAGLRSGALDANNEIEPGWRPALPSPRSSPQGAIFKSWKLPITVARPAKYYCAFVVVNEDITINSRWLMLASTSCALTVFRSSRGRNVLSKNG